MHMHVYTCVYMVSPTNVFSLMETCDWHSLTSLLEIVHCDGIRSRYGNVLTQLSKVRQNQQFHFRQKKNFYMLQPANKSDCMCWVKPNSLQSVSLKI